MQVAREPAYRKGGKTGKNLTPRPADVPSGLSCTDTKGKGWTFEGGREAITAAGFEVELDPTDEDPGHFLVRPGAGQGHTLVDWAATRETLDESKPDTWHPLTTLLRSLAS